MFYPRFKYHPDKEPVLVRDEAHEKELGDDWYNSPADYGVETEPGKTPDPVILAKKIAFEKMRAAQAPAHAVEAPKRGRRKAE